MAHMIQKVLKVGSSVAVTIPKKSLKELGLKAGDTVSLTIDASRRRVIVEPSNDVDKELIEWTKSFIERYRPTLEALAKK